MALLPLLLLPVLLLVAAADAFPASCLNATCGGHAIHYPFWLNDATSDCGYPGLGLVCENNDTLILPVKLHRYRVGRIDYPTHTLVVSDDDVADESEFGCPRLHVNLTIDYASYWLQLTQFDSNVTFLYGCNKNLSSSSVVELRGCPESSTGKTSFMLLDDVATGTEAYECEAVVVATVLEEHKKELGGGGSSPPAPENASLFGGPGGVVWAGFELKYSAHSQQCDRCERSGGWCGYRHNQTNGGDMMFTCFCNSGPTSHRCDFSGQFSGLELRGLVRLP
ncbi:hypothetical protein HU200_036962 [Digitaria exilis]|uniref:Uncharacterized protein n=1 Tax=Digitaria exilis TaxID=1010633 RepID=A0A835BES4_9POAL|nr:hypothetical protein HU200_036962 [Digitaria exilis]